MASCKTSEIEVDTHDDNIPQDQLVRGEYYIGEGRFIQGMALWDGEMFHGFQNKFGRYLQTSAVYGATGFDPKCHIKHK